MSYKSAISAMSLVSEPKTYMKYCNITDALNEGYYILDARSNSKKSKKSKKRKRSSQFIHDVIMNNDELDYKLILIMENLKSTYDNFEGCYETFLKEIKKNIKCKLIKGLENEDETENDDFF